MKLSRRCSKNIKLDVGRHDRLDLTVYQTENEPKVIYLGRASSVIVFDLDDIDKVIEFINKARTLELDANVI